VLIGVLPRIVRARLMIRKSASHVIEVRQRLPKESPDMRIIDRVECPCAHLAGAHQAMQTQHAQLMRNTRVRNPSNGRQIGHTPLPARERQQNTDPGRVSKRSKRISQMLDRPGIKQSRARSGHRFWPGRFGLAAHYNRTLLVNRMRCIYVHTQNIRPTMPVVQSGRCCRALHQHPREREDFLVPPLPTHACLCYAGSRRPPSNGSSVVWAEEYEEMSPSMQSQGSGTLLQGRYELQSTIRIDESSRSHIASDNRFPGRFVTVVERAMRDPATTQRLRDQAHALAALPRHPAIPAVTDIFISDDRLYVVMDYTAGPTFGDLARRNDQPFAETQVLSWGLVLADALAYLHEQEPPVIHGAVGLERASLRPDGAPALRDFGRACPELAASTACDPACAAPECDSALAGAPADVYGLGAVLYTLLAGASPPPATARQTGAQPLLPLRKRNPSVSAATAAAVQSALALSPAERPSMRELHQGLRDALAILQRKADVAPTDNLGTHPLGPIASNEAEATTAALSPKRSTISPRFPRWLMLAVIALIFVALVASTGAIAVPLFMGWRAAHKSSSHPIIRPVPHATATPPLHRASNTPTAPHPTPASANSSAIVPTPTLPPSTVQTCIQMNALNDGTTGQVATGSGNPPPMASVAVVVTGITRCPDHIEINVIERSINFSGNWDTWSDIASQSRLLDNMGGQYMASVPQSHTTSRQVRAQPGDQRWGSLWFPLTSLPGGTSSLTLQFAAAVPYTPGIITVSGIPVPEEGQTSPPIPAGGATPVVTRLRPPRIRIEGQGDMPHNPPGSASILPSRPGSATPPLHRRWRGGQRMRSTQALASLGAVQTSGCALREPPRARGGQQHRSY